VPRKHKQTEKKNSKDKNRHFSENEKKIISHFSNHILSLLSLSFSGAFVKKKSERFAPEGKKKRTRRNGGSRGAPGGTESLERGAREFAFFFVFFVFFFVSSEKK